MAETCIPLKDSTTCPAFSKASFSTKKEIVDLYPFLAFVSNVEDFDKELESYVHRDYVKLKYQTLIGCSNVNLRNTSSLYARYTTSVLCNGIIQNSKDICNLSPENSRPLCADTCALAATSEEMIAVNPDLCGTPKNNFMDQIRSDFTVCAIPADSLTGKCISGSDNEQKECGYGPNLLGLCGFCAESSPNATDSCCVAADAPNRCRGLELPTLSPLPPLFPTSTSSSTPSASTGASPGGLSGGAIAGIVVGSVAGVALLAALGVFLFIFLRRRREREGSIFNQPTPPRKGTNSMQYAPGSRGDGTGYEVLPGGRVARMSALQSNEGSPPRGAAGGRYDSSDTETFASPGSRTKGRLPVTGRRNGSLSSTSVLDTSPKSGDGAQFSSPEGVASGQSEQLPYFRDYYSQDDIHPNDKVSVLWAYQPRAADEFELERGDMLKIVGIWDDGWATGVRISERAEDYDGKHKPQRDSGVSNGPERRGSSPVPMGDIKAFPLVCVCLPEHWKKTIEGDPQRMSMDTQ
ncbi:predicted protein [Uncinocarpus reesii 1704]|uniref:SH3 domain-containing protein n=1 Tax=Uncinocarpus reesii (strain UAMH 1704) TaxID=336963 RepID=C4JDC7_UNCRE|nr:uncharacterized protein UREG_00687 [Uncinocarpus reesii 1704]EEP75840.1 predicted protein [Uncinocarpus reesii 1704]